MVEIRAFPGRERLTMTFKGHALDNELERAEEQLLKEALPRLAPAFDMISDISHAERLSPGAVERLRRMGRLIIAAGLRIHVRVVGRSGHAAVQFERISRAVGDDSRLAYSLAEAEALLDGGR